MTSMNHERIFTSIGIAAIILLLFGLGGWYFFLRTQTDGIESASSSRGFSIGIPSFVGSRGSTAANTARSGTAQEFTTSPGSAFARLLGIGTSLEGERSETSIITPPTESNNSSEHRAPRFWRVTAAPVAGAAFSYASSTQLRYVERASGNVFDADPRTGDITRVTNTLIPRVYEALIGTQGFVGTRTIEEGKTTTLVGTISTSTEGGIAELSAVNLGIDVDDIVVAPQSSDLLLIARGTTGNHLIRSSWNGSNPKQLLALPGGDFRIFPTGNVIILAERAASGIAGNAYRVGAQLVPILRNVPGLTIRTQAATGNILYGEDDGTRLRLFVRLANAAAAEINLATTAEKCVWAPEGSKAYCAVPRATPARFIDAWYRGDIHTADTWYTVDASSEKTATLFTMDDASGIDVENPIIDPSGQYLAFTNARDKSLWVLRISE